jgi:hypothetical protein
MPTLASDLRNKLEHAVIEARDAAEAGARAALESLAVHYLEPYPHMNAAQRKLRNHLRARARQLGDRQESAGRLAIDHLVAECAYEHWHRMLFARFLAENGLLIEPQENMAISLAEAEELAKEDGVDVWVFASRCAQRMLPQIFQPDDPLLAVSFATEHMLKLEKLLASLPQAVFTASDSLGWVYQFWQSKKKDEINRSEVKIGADEISAVTQLFTEPYMVEFLLHNTLGAWWAGKKLASKDAYSAKGEDELRRKLALPGVGWEYLRFVRGADGAGGPWRPATGTFDGWPKTAAELKVLDPCCGSGHFLVAALHYLVPIRKAEEGLSTTQAVDAVLRDNLHGLEIDERCCQIAAFALAFAAWTYPDAGGYRPLPELPIACSGLGPQCTQEQWVKLAEQSGIPIPTVGREAIKNGLLNLHRLFSQAPTLGSLINPAELSADLIAADYVTIQPYLAAILKAEKADDETRERAIAAAGMVKAAELLVGKYTLVITNVPYLARGKQDVVIIQYGDAHHADTKWELATMFIDRCLSMLDERGAACVVSPQNWLFSARFDTFRQRLLIHTRLNIVARLGAGAFGAISGEVVKVTLGIFTPLTKSENDEMAMLDVLGHPTPEAKASALRDAPFIHASCAQQLRNPNARILLAEADFLSGDLLESCADCYQGLVTGDAERFIRRICELSKPSDGWVPFMTAPYAGSDYEGRSSLLKWEGGSGALAEYAAATRDKLHDMHESGQRNWGKPGVAIGRVTRKVMIYSGEHFDNAVATIVPKDTSLVPALYCFTKSPEFIEKLQVLDQKLSLTNRTILKVDFDIARWQRVADEDYPNGLPEPESDDPTQWLFHGWPEESTSPLQVAVGRLIGYRWPAELDPDMRLSKRARALVKRCDELAKFADDDGIVSISSVRGEEPAAERLIALLAAAGIKPAKVRELTGGADLDDWLRNRFFEEHCKLFHDRAFVWHIWDSRKRDGFHALVNYHKLCEGGSKGRKLLESLTYSYLGEWITRQKDGVQRGEGGAEDRLAAALELKKRLEAILEGEPPFDLFVRWKPLAEQPIGWEPDINDGVRVNIRPFLASDLLAGRTGAGVLRFKPNINWTKDRGKEPQRPKAEYPWFWGWDEETQDFMGGKTFDGNRWNGCHYTNKAKQAAREAAKGAKCA